MALIWWVFTFYRYNHGYTTQSIEPLYAEWFRRKMLFVWFIIIDRVQLIEIQIGTLISIYLAGFLGDVITHFKLPNFNDALHDEFMKWKHVPRYWPFVRGIHRFPVNSPHKGQWRGALISSLICVWINSWLNNRQAGNLRRYRANYDVIVINSTAVNSLRPSDAYMRR